ncbi:glycerophosphodiester phosphodiesterase [Nakamurella flava]|uniref:glycerophosphodiester phosphodiesterase n=1 Tax=Nakamurella flava TaxID=2576308 RepID=UPI00140E37F4|nr:glycerophosphodiester phosphodiesterase [Nakamurella flava]
MIGHRGSPRRAPENTLASFRAAWAAGVDWVEADVQPTIDGVPVVLHDDTIDRTTDDTGVVRHLPWAEVGQLTLHGAPGAVPRLTELLAELTGPRRLLLEIKGPHSPADLRRLLAELAASGADHRVFLQSFERDVLAELRVLVPDRPLGLLVETLDDADLAAADELAVVAINPSVECVLTRPSVITELRARGRSVAVWTADEPDQWDALARAGVDGVITDRPGDLARYRTDGEPPFR